MMMDTDGFASDIEPPTKRESTNEKRHDSYEPGLCVCGWRPELAANYCQSVAAYASRVSTADHRQGPLEETLMKANFQNVFGKGFLTYAQESGILILSVISQV
jgi:hypothetical protein